MGWLSEYLKFIDVPQTGAVAEKKGAGVARNRSP